MAHQYNFSGIIAGLRSSILAAGGTPQLFYENNFKGIIQAIEDLQVSITALASGGGGGSGTIQAAIDDLVLNTSDVTGSLSSTESKVNAILAALRGYPVIQTSGGGTGNELIPVFVVPSAM
jgi:hypothetical protein